MPTWAFDPVHGGACRAAHVGIIQDAITVPAPSLSRDRAARRGRRRSVGTSDVSRRNSLHVRPWVPSGSRPSGLTHAPARGEDLELHDLGVVDEVPNYADRLTRIPLWRRQFSVRSAYRNVGMTVDLARQEVVERMCVIRSEEELRIRAFDGRRRLRVSVSVSAGVSTAAGRGRGTWVWPRCRHDTASAAPCR